MNPDKAVKVHLACGTRYVPGYVNTDIQPYGHADLRCDISRLPWKDDSIDVIYSCAVIEHFGRNEWESVLAHWFSKLKPGGTLRISTADFEAACLEYIQNRRVEDLLGLIVGGQKDDYDWHGMIFDERLLRRALQRIGFVNIRRYDWRNTDLAQLGIDDFSQAYLPHMDKEGGRLMMLNMEAEKPLSRQPDDEH